MAENESKSSASSALTSTSRADKTSKSSSNPSVPQGGTVDPIGGEQSAAERQTEQLGGDWPVPGDEGYVHPDGTPQSAAQLADNRRAAADRAAAGSAVHGAPAATPGPQLPEVAAAAVERAEADGGRTDAERAEALTDYVREAQARPARDADDSGNRTTR